MKKLILLMCLSATVLVYQSCGSSETDSTEMAEEQNEQNLDNKMEDDAEFAVDAASGGMMEVELGKLALNNASSQQVKDFAQTMVDEHSAANSELQAAAQSKNIVLPTTVEEDRQKKIQELSEKKGAEFDKAYIDFMVEDHKEDIEAFKKEANDGHDADLKAWANGKVPVLQHHLEMAESIQKSMK